MNIFWSIACIASLAGTAYLGVLVHRWLVRTHEVLLTRSGRVLSRKTETARSGEQEPVAALTKSSMLR